MKKEVIFREQEIVDFCRVTQDTNVIHDPDFMTRLKKRVVVPGMYAFSCAINLSAGFLRQSANRIEVHFASLLSAGDQVMLSVGINPLQTGEIRLSAVNHKDMLTASESYTRMLSGSDKIIPQREGFVRSLPVSPEACATFARLIDSSDALTARFLFAVAYASQALFTSIRDARTEVEHEIDQLINGDNLVSPFYQSLRITIPLKFPDILDRGELDYLIQFEREKKNKTYIAHLECQQAGRIIYQSHYKLVAIPDKVILRMAKEMNV